jgi:putative Holliday junction resolvase
MGRILALDYGQKKIGVAVSDESRMFAQVLEPAVPCDGKELSRLAALVKKYAVTRIVVGLPTSLSGQREKSVLMTEEFIRQLRNKIETSIETFDERFTTIAASQILKEQNLGRGKKKELIDNTSAWVLLQNYLDSANEKKSA